MIVDVKCFIFQAFTYRFFVLSFCLSFARFTESKANYILACEMNPLQRAPQCKVMYVKNVIKTVPTVEHKDSHMGIVGVELTVKETVVIMT